MPPGTTGQWTGAIHFVVSPKTINDGDGHTISDARGLFVLHAVLLHTGKVLVFGGHVERAFYPPLSYVFDPLDPGTDQPAIPFPSGMDLFCCHYVQLPNGNVLVVGGSEKTYVEHGSTGAKNICFFKPSTRSPGGAWFNTGHELIQGRWYPTPVIMPDGRVMVVSGRPQHGGGVISDKVEMLSPPHRASTELTGATKSFPIYPGLHLAPNGKVYWTHTTWGQEIDNPPTSSITVADGAAAATWTEYAGKQPTQPRREEGMSVLLPLTGAATDGQILVIGGSLALKADGVTSVLRGADPTGPTAFSRVHTPSDCRSADMLDTTRDPPVWTAVGPMLFAHTNGHCVLLPDETVLICGGHNGYKWQAEPGTTPTVEAELFTPAGTGGTFSPLSATPAETDDRMHVPFGQSRGGRMYHSIALLMPDGRVLVAGGANPNDAEDLITPYPAGWTKAKYGVPADPNPEFRPGMPLNDKSFEFYEPSYYFKPNHAAQPKIDDVTRGGSTTRRVRYGSTFKIKTMQAASIDRVIIMRPGAPTHHTDTEQRSVRLTDVTKGTNELTVKMESDPKRAPPGFYMLWIVDNLKRPCQDAVFIHLVK
jgi:galactose oxidase-like protein/glyoxal oxidase-like protein